jgi:hypothetical protein
LGDAEQRATLDLVQMMLNPFSQEVHRIGRAITEDTSNLLIDYEPLFACKFGCCPTLLLPSTLLDPETAILVHSRWLDTFEGAAWAWQRILHHPFDPWTRIEEEVQASVQKYVYGNSNPEIELRRLKHHLSEFKALDFARFALSTEHMIPEFQAFSYAWKGSINIQREVGNSVFASRALQFDDFLEWFSVIANSCRFPEGTDARPAN